MMPHYQQRVLEFKRDEHSEAPYQICSGTPENR
jgi:hypothetical protein